MNGSRHFADTHDDPMEAMGNLFDVAILIGLGFMIMALSSFGLKDILASSDVTIVKNPGAKDMEIITKKGGRIERLKTTSEQAQGTGQAIGTVYRLEDGRTVWVPDAGTQAPADSIPTPADDPSLGLPGTIPSTPSTTSVVPQQFSTPTQPTTMVPVP